MSCAPNQRLHLTPRVGAEADRTVSTLHGAGLVFLVAFWVLVAGFQKFRCVCGAGEPRPLGSANEGDN
jgi:hypothetical protein